MANPPEYNIQTRSRATREGAALLAEPKLNFLGVGKAPMHSGRIQKAPLNVSWTVSPTTEMNEAQSKDMPGTIPLRETVDTPQMAMDCSDSSCNTPTDAPALHRPVDPSLVVCCSECNCVFQRDAHKNIPCPLCRLKYSDRAAFSQHFSRLGCAVTESNEKLLAVERNLADLQQQVGTLNDNLEKATIQDPALQVIENMTTAVQLDALERKYKDLDNINVSDFLRDIEEKQMGLLDMQAKYIDLQLALTKTLESLEILLKQTDKSVGKLVVDPTKGGLLAANTSLVEDSLTLDKDAEDESISARAVCSKAVLLAADLNIAKAQTAGSSVLQTDRRVKIHGRPGDNLADTISFCQDWLRNIKGEALVIFHSGLNDILQISRDNPSSFKDVKQLILDAVSSLFKECQSVGAQFKACSIPEVIDFRTRIDWRSVVFEINVALQKLSLELGFEFIDLTELTNQGSISMARNGIQYNRAGQLKVLDRIATSVSSWLGTKVNRQGSSVISGKTLLRTGSKVQHNTQAPHKSIKTRRNDLLHGQRVNVRGFQRQSTAVREKSEMHSTPPWLLSRRVPTGAYDERRYSVRQSNTFHQRENNALISQQDHLNPWLPGFVPWSH